MIEALARLGTREVNLIGGEAYLRPDLNKLVRHIREYGMDCFIQTGGRQLTHGRLRAAADAGLQGIGVSLDGMEKLHDELRGVNGSFASALDALRFAREVGLSTSVNTQLGARTAVELPRLLETIAEAGARHWQIQLTAAMGNAVDNAHLLLQPYQLLDVMPLLARLYDDALRRGVLIQMGNSIGYFGPYEYLWRGLGDERRHWAGCSGGHTVIALESDGLVKGCPSLASVDFGSGNVRELSLADIWHRSERMRFSRLRSVDQLWGFCRSCYYADVCLAGCTWTSHSLLGKAGNNPYCHHRAIQTHE